MSEADEPKKKQARLGHEESDQVCAFAALIRNLSHSDLGLREERGNILRILDCDLILNVRRYQTYELECSNVRFTWLILSQMLVHSSGKWGRGAVVEG